MGKLSKILLGISTIVLSSSLLLFSNVEPAHAVLVGTIDNGFSTANGYNKLPGVVETSVWHQGTDIFTVSASYIIPGAVLQSVCRTSAFFYYVKPGGPAASLGYQSLDSCSYEGGGYFTIQVNRDLPSGSRICSKFMQNNIPVGGEPCVKI